MTHSLDDALVEKVGRAILSEVVCYKRNVIQRYGRAALEAAGVAELREENKALRKALTRINETGDVALDIAWIRRISRAALNPRQNEEEGE